MTEETLSGPLMTTDKALIAETKVAILAYRTRDGAGDLIDIAARLASRLEQALSTGPAHDAGLSAAERIAEACDLAERGALPTFGTAHVLVTVADLRLILQALAGGGGKVEGWLPIVLAPTDGAWRTCRLPDGSEVVAAFEGHGLGPMARRWRVKTFGYHNPERPSGEQRGGVDQMIAAYDTFVIQNLPEGVYPTHFRPNDTVYGPPEVKDIAP